MNEIVKRRIVIGGVATIVLALLTSFCYIMINRHKLNTQDEIITETNTIFLNNDEQNQTEVENKVEKTYWTFEISDPLIEDFMNARWGYHLVDFEEYALDDITYVVAYNNSEFVNTKDVKIVALYDITKPAYSFPAVISYPMDVTLSKEYFEIIQGAEDAVKYNVADYTFVIIDSYMDRPYEILASMDTRKFDFVEYPKIGYPVEWIRTDEDPYYRNKLQSINIDNPFWNYFDVMEELTLNDGTKVVAKRIDLFERADHKKGSWTLEEIASLNSKAKTAYEKLKNDAEFIEAKYQPEVSRDLAEGTQCCSAPSSDD